MNEQDVCTERELQSRVIEKLRRSGLPDLLQLTVITRNGRVVLEGQVHSYYAKQLAQSLAGRVEGIGALKNNVEVSRNGAPLQHAR